ncbi:branched-chain amino acid ABC transporter permease [Protaetiibacter intestinalis]|uniref:Branched-chain amino acid ABC transporter permease n=1 Tax=Protaetiibacter intestinalis TaxID=2419774 RepID=A0A387B3W5_9MICO|nr:branched-chain amino acid ABC transporter permease [Protaetiibacter intestinalis]AYF98272.1 branched-chain amino acid ABC transporter permease [Protaetiibacter intestinalis]
MTRTQATDTPAPDAIRPRHAKRRHWLLVPAGWSPLQRWGATVIILVLALAGTFLLDPYRNYLLALATAYVCGTAGLSLLVGRTGQLSLGHAAFMAAGAYAFAFTSNALADAEAPSLAHLLLPFLVAVVASSLLGLVVGIAGARLHGPYLAGLTLALVVALSSITATFSGLFGGDAGFYVSVERRPEWLASIIAQEQWQAWVGLVVAAIVLGALSQLVRSPAALRMQAVRDDEPAARLSGIDPVTTRVGMFGISAAAAGLGGGVLAYVTQAVSPGAYGLTLSLFLLVAVVIGGVGTLAGAVWGAVVIVLVPELTSALTEALPLPAELSQRLDGNLAIVVFGVILVVVMLAAPRGIHGAVAGLVSRLRRHRGRPGAPTPTT